MRLAQPKFVLPKFVLPKFVLPKFVIAAVAMSMLSACGINSVPTAQENATARWADVEAAYQRRADLIPNLANTAERFAEQERTVLTEVTEARAKATSVQVNADDLNDPAKMQAFGQAQGQLGQSLGRLLASFEAYPDLKSNQNFLALQNELERTENRINIARRDYNQAVQDYNTTIRTFPDIIGAKVIHGAKPLVPFEADAGSEKAPEVFGKS